MLEEGLKLSDAHMILLAITALLSFPLVISHKFSKSRITITKNRFSCQIQEEKSSGFRTFPPENR